MPNSMRINTQGLSIKPLSQESKTILTKVLGKGFFPKLPSAVTACNNLAHRAQNIKNLPAMIEKAKAQQTIQRIIAGLEIFGAVILLCVAIAALALLISATNFAAIAILGTIFAASTLADIPVVPALITDAGDRWSRVRDLTHDLTQLNDKKALNKLKNQMRDACQEAMVNITQKLNAQPHDKQLNAAKRELATLWRWVSSGQQLAIN